MGHVANNLSMSDFPKYHLEMIIILNIYSQIWPSVIKPKKKYSCLQLHLLLLHSLVSFVSKTFMVLGLNCGKSAFVIVIYLIAAASPLHLATLLPQSSEKWPWA